MKKAVTGAAGRFVILLALLLFMLFLTSSGWLLFAVLLLIAVPLVSCALNRFVSRKLTVHLFLPTASAKHTAVTAELEIENKSFLPVLSVWCTLILRNDLTGEVREILLPEAVGAGQKTRDSFLLESGYTGRLSLSAESLRVMDFFGFLPVKRKADAVVRMTVLPELFPVDVSLTARAADSEEGSADRKGHDRSELFQLRDYRPGDDVRQIHWKLSSKLDELIFKEPGEPLSRSVMVFWDKRKTSSPAAMDALAEAVSSVCMRICGDGIPFTLVWMEEELQAEDISDENGLLAAVPALVKTAGNADCPLPDMAEYGLVLYFAGELPEENFPDKVHFILCAETADAPDTTAFSEDTVREDLARLEVGV